MDTFKRVLKHMRPHWYLLALAIMLMGLLTLAGMVRPMLSKLLIDRVIKGEHYDELAYVALGFLAVALFRGVFNYLRQMAGQNFGQRVIYDLRNRLYERLQYLGFTYYDNARTGQIMSRLTSDVEWLRHFISFGIVDFFDFIFMVGFALVILFSIEWRLALVSMATMPFLVFLVFRFDKQIRPAFRSIRKQMADLNSVLQENITGVRAVKAFAREPHEKDKFEGENSEYRTKQLTAVDIWSTFFPFMDLMSGVSTVAVLWYGGTLVIQQAITLGDLVAFIGYIGYLIWPIRMLGWLVNLYEQAMAAAERLFELLDEPSSVTDAPDAIELKHVQGRVTFKNVSFSYDEKDSPALVDINIDAPAGSTIALLGTTGAGKTSLVNLIPRFYDPVDGEVLVDGHNVRVVTQNSLRENIGIVLQETFLFSTTIRENITYGRRDSSMEEIISAAKAAQAHDFISDLPQGYDTIVGERGLGLSGGQKQRVAIARALLVDPRILILDDSTSSVDMVTELQIQRALNRVMEGRTTFVIAHRLSTIKNADEILVLEEGRIVERGTHHELIRESGIYREIYKVQFKDQEEVFASQQGDDSVAG